MKQWAMWGKKPTPFNPFACLSSFFLPSPLLQNEHLVAGFLAMGSRFWFQASMRKATAPTTSKNKLLYKTWLVNGLVVG